MSKKKRVWMDKDILCGDQVTTKITMKNKTKTKKVTATIKWKGQGPFFGPGIWYRVDIDGKRHFFQKDAIIKNFSMKTRKHNTSIEVDPTKKNGSKKQKRKVKKTKWINIHFVGCPDITKKNKQFKMHMSLQQSSTFEVVRNMMTYDAKDDDDGDDKEDEKNVNLEDLEDISMIGGMEEMGRKRSQSHPKPQIAHIKNKLSVNEIYSLKGVESRSIRIHINPKIFTVDDLKSYITAKFKIPATSKILLVYNNCTLAMQDEPISYYGIDNHSCLLLCISEPPPNSKKSTNRNRSIRNRSNARKAQNRNESDDNKSQPFRKRLNKFCSKFEIQRITDLDIYTFETDHNCIKMPCGHGMPKESLFAYAEAQFKSGKKILKCPHLKDREKNTLCQATWNFQLVRKILLSEESPRVSHDPALTNDAAVAVPLWADSLFGVIVIGYWRENTPSIPIYGHLALLLRIYQYCLDKKREMILRRPGLKRMMRLEIECAKNKFIDAYDYQKCINCSLFIYRKQVPMDKVKCFCLCPLCESKFCWLCSNEWKTRDKAKHCGNNECTVSWTKQHLGILQKCKTKTIGRVSGIPEVRACPKCNELIFHVTACKHMSCRSCGTQFCFCCLKLYQRPGGWQCGSSGAVCPIAKRQKLNCLTNTNRGNVELFKLLH